MALEPIREVVSDNAKERTLATFLQKHMNWELFPTPKFYFTDFHILQLYDNGRKNYIGDLEIKWLNIPSNVPAIFPFNKLQQMIIAPPYTDSPNSFHRICFRFTDGLMMLPVLELARLQPEIHTRRDTNETDLVVKVKVSDYTNFFKPLVIGEEL
jgi:hypothetical protein